MRDEELDAILSREQEIAPSSGFVASVMEAVSQQAGAPPPIPFPWWRALPGLAAVVIAAGVLLIAALASILKGAAAAPTAVELPCALAVTLEFAKATRAGWLVLALAISFVSVKLSTLFAANGRHH